MPRLKPIPFPASLMALSVSAFGIGAPILKGIACSRTAWRKNILTAVLRFRPKVSNKA